MTFCSASPECSNETPCEDNPTSRSSFSRCIGTLLHVTASGQVLRHFVHIGSRPPSVERQLGSRKRRRESSPASPTLHKSVQRVAVDPDTLKECIGHVSQMVEQLWESLIYPRTL
jgi:hypothetical protein